MIRKNLESFEKIKIGLEVELEFNSDLSVDPGIVPEHLEHLWSAVYDGSLRNGIEFIFNGAKTPIEAEKAIAVLNTEILNPINHCRLTSDNILTTDRTSIHVHLDFRGYDRSSVINFILKYLVFEEVLFKLVHPFRIKNNYCKPLSNSSLLNDPSFDIIETSLVMYGDKYSSLNSKTIPTLGTLEFRHHHGSRDSDEIRRWVVTLLTLREYLIKVNFDGILSDCKLKPYEILTGLLGEEYPEVDLEGVMVALKRGVTTLERLLEKKRLASIRIPKGTLVNFNNILKG